MGSQFISSPLQNRTPAFEPLASNPIVSTANLGQQPENDLSSWWKKYRSLPPTEQTMGVRLAQVTNPTPASPDRSQLMRCLSALFDSQDYDTLLSGTYSGKTVITPPSGRLGQVTLTPENFPGTQLPMNHVVATIENADHLDIEALYTALTNTGDYVSFYKDFYDLFYIHTRRNNSSVAIPGIGSVDDWYADYWFNTTKPKDNSAETPSDYPDGYGMNHDRSYAWRDSQGEMTAFVFGWEMMPVDGKLFREAAQLKYQRKELLDDEEKNKEKIGKIDQRLQEIKGEGDAYTNRFIDGHFRFPSAGVELDNDGTPDSENPFIGHAAVQNNTGGYMVWYDKQNQTIHVEVYLVSIPGQKLTDHAPIQLAMASAQRQAGEGLVRYTLQKAVKAAEKKRQTGSNSGSN